MPHKRKGHWPRGRRRNTVDAVRFFRAVVDEFGAREIGRRCGVADRTVRRWAAGEDWPTPAVLHRLIDSLCPQSTGAMPVYDSSMALDGNTRTGGVGEFSIRAARADQTYLERMFTDDDSKTEREREAATESDP